MLETNLDEPHAFNLFDSSQVHLRLVGHGHSQVGRVGLSALRVHDGSHDGEWFALITVIPYFL